MNKLETIGRNLRRLRLSSDLTQAQLALQVGLSKDTISKIEQGKQKNIGIKYLILICRVLNADLEQLFIKDAKSILVNFTVSDGSVRALGEIIKQAQKILKKEES